MEKHANPPMRKQQGSEDARGGKKPLCLNRAPPSMSALTTLAYFSTDHRVTNTRVGEKAFGVFSDLFMTVP